MVTTVAQNFRLYNTKQFKAQVSDVANNNLYFFISKVQPWANESAPPSTEDTIENVQYDLWRRLLSMKKVLVSDISHAAPRYDWSSGTIYTQYSSNSTFYTNPFYVINQDYQVYKCLGNNNGNASTVMPTGTSASAFNTGDGYRWKYLYSISAADVLKYVTTNYIPVKTLTTDDGSTQWPVQEAANNASLETFVIDVPGSGYRYQTGTAQSGTASTITLGTGASAVNGFYNGMSVYIVSGDGAGQIRTIANYNGTTKVASVTSNFDTTPSLTSLYVVAPRMVINGDGTGFKGYPVVIGGALSTINIIDPGVNYSYATVTFVSNTSIPASVRPNLSPPGGHGSDPVAELYAKNLMFNVQLSGSESNTFMTQNDYRVVGLMLNPQLANSAMATSSTYDQTTKLTLTSQVGTLLKDETISGVTSGATATVVEYYSGSVLRTTNVLGAFSSGETITGGSSGATATISSVSSVPLKPGSGTTLFIENRTSIQRSSDQQEDYKIVVKF